MMVAEWRKRCGDSGGVMAGPWSGGGGDAKAGRWRWGIGGGVAEAARRRRNDGGGAADHKRLW